MGSKDDLKSAQLSTSQTSEEEDDRQETTSGSFKKKYKKKSHKSKVKMMKDHDDQIEDEDEDDRPLVQRLKLSTRRLTLKPGKTSAESTKLPSLSSALLSSPGLTDPALDKESSSSEDSGWEDSDADQLTPMTRLLKEKKWPGRFYRKFPPRVIPRPERFDTSTTARFQYFHDVHANKCYFSGFLFKSDLVPIGLSSEVIDWKMIYNISAWDREFGKWTKWWAELLGSKLFLWRVDAVPFNQAITQHVEESEEPSIGHTILKKLDSSDQNSEERETYSKPASKSPISQKDPTKNFVLEASSMDEAIQFELEPDFGLIEEIKASSMPICIDISDCFVEESITIGDQQKVLPPFPYTSNFCVSFDGIDLVHFATPSVVSTSSWVTAIRLVNYEIAALNLAFSVSVLRISPYINAWADLGIPLFGSKFFSDGITFYGRIEAKHAFETDWKEYYCVVTQEKHKKIIKNPKNQTEKGNQKRKSLFFGGGKGRQGDESGSSNSSSDLEFEEEEIRSQIIFYENKVDMKKGQFPRFIIDDIVHVHACWPGSSELVKQDMIELVKVYGSIRIQNLPPPSKKEQKDAAKRELKKEAKKENKRESRFDFHTRNGIGESVLVTKQNKEDTEVAGFIEVLSDAKNVPFPPFIYLKPGNSHDSFHWLVAIFAAFQIDSAVERADYNSDLWAYPPDEWGTLALQLDELKHVSGTEHDLESFKIFDQIFQDKKMIFHFGLADDWRKAKKHTTRIRDRHEVIELEHKARELIDWALEADASVKLPKWTENEILILRPPPTPPPVVDPPKDTVNKTKKSGNDSSETKQKPTPKDDNEMSSSEQKNIRKSGPEALKIKNVKGLVPDTASSEHNVEKVRNESLDDAAAEEHAHPSPQIDTEDFKEERVAERELEEEETRGQSLERETTSGKKEKKAKKRRSLLDFFKKSNEESDEDEEELKTYKKKKEKKIEKEAKKRLDHQSEGSSSANKEKGVKSESDVESTNSTHRSQGSWNRTSEETDATSEKDTSVSSISLDRNTTSSDLTASSPESTAPKIAKSINLEASKKSKTSSSSGIMASPKVEDHGECAGDASGESSRSDFDMSPESDYGLADKSHKGNEIAYVSNTESSSPEMYPQHNAVNVDEDRKIIPHARKARLVGAGASKFVNTNIGQAIIKPRTLEENSDIIVAEEQPDVSHQVQSQLLEPQEGPDPDSEAIAETEDIPEPVIVIDLTQSLPEDLLFNTYDCTASWIEIERSRAEAHRQWVQAVDSTVSQELSIPQGDSDKYIFESNSLLSNRRFPADKRVVEGPLINAIKGAPTQPKPLLERGLLAQMQARDYMMGRGRGVPPSMGMYPPPPHMQMMGPSHPGMYPPGQIGPYPPIPPHGAPFRPITPMPPPQGYYVPPGQTGRPPFRPQPGPYPYPQSTGHSFQPMQQPMYQHSQYAESQVGESILDDSKKKKKSRRKSSNTHSRLIDKPLFVLKTDPLEEIKVKETPPPVVKNEVKSNPEIKEQKKIQQHEPRESFPKKKVALGQPPVKPVEQEESSESEESTAS